MTAIISETEAPKNIVQLISQISAEAKAIELTNQAGVPFPFRGVDTTVNHLAPLLQKYGVIVVPSVVSVIVTPREAGNRVVKTSEVITEFKFYAPDGSSVVARTAGLADDFGDRSSAQAQSVAFRIALLQTFTLPTQVTDPEEAGQKTEDEAVEARAKAVKPPTKTEQNIADVRSEISAIIADETNSYDGVAVNELGNEITGKAPNDWGGDVTSLRKLLKELRSRVADPKTDEVA